MVAELARQWMAGRADAAVVLRSAGLSDVGRQREVNEDRLHIDVARGIFIVVDGVGGHAAGGRAADIAVRLLRERLERQTGAVDDRVREAITIANNEIFHEARQRPEWHGMACVLTVAVVEGDRLVIGHVGDTRLYLFQAGHARKLTPDHSPVGEREDARELSEREAMAHPRRNEVFRDVGSTVHQLADRDFIHINDVDFPPDAALLVCSDGLTDLVPLETIRQIVYQGRGRPDDVVGALVRAANDAGGRDNVTAVYAEGERFAGAPAAGAGAAPGAGGGLPSGHRRAWAVALLAILLGLGGLWAWRAGWIGRDAVVGVLTPPATGAIVVRAGESIGDAVAQAQPGSSVVVEPGEYRERLTLRDHVRVISRVPRGVTLRLPEGSMADDAVVVAAGVVGAELSGVRIVGDETSPLGVGIMTRDASVRLVDLEVTGATIAAVAFGVGDDVMLMGSDIHDNPGAAVVVGPGATPRLTHNRFAGNGAASDSGMSFVFEAGARPEIIGNVFDGTGPGVFSSLDEDIAEALPSTNVFFEVRAHSPGARPSPAPRSR